MTPLAYFPSLIRKVLFFVDYFSCCMDLLLGAVFMSPGFVDKMIITVRGHRRPPSSLRMFALSTDMEDASNAAIRIVVFTPVRL
jgi:hypothetical protein